MALPSPAPFDDTFPFLGYWPSGKPMSYKGDAHLLMVARPGAGKNRSVILPNLAYYKGSVLVLDPKAENAKATARWREENLGQKVYVFDPFRIVPDDLLPSNGRASFNPVWMIRQSGDYAFSTAYLVAQSLIIPSMKESYWDDRATGWLAALLLYVATSAPIPDDLRTLRTVWRFFADPSVSESALRQMRKCSDFFISGQGFDMAGLKITALPDGSLVERLSEDSKSVDSVRSTFRTQLVKTLSENSILEATEGPALDFGSLSSVPSSVYVCLPGKLAQVHSRFMRLLVACALSQIEDAGLAPVGPGGARAPSTLFVLDEFATLGKFPAIVEAMGRMRGYGLKFWTVVQTLAQLKSIYGADWETVTGNAGVIQCFGGTNCLTTANTISQLSGEEKKIVESRSGSEGPGSHAGWSKGEQLGPVIYPGEVRSYPEAEQIVLVLGEKGPRTGATLLKKDHSQIAPFRDYQPASRPAPPLRLLSAPTPEEAPPSAEVVPLRREAPGAAD